MTMFDNFIGNAERTRGNMLRDAGWSLILIDFSRAFGIERELHYKMDRIDDAYWQRLERPCLNEIGCWSGRPSSTPCKSLTL